MKKILLVIFLCLFVYCGVYLILSLNGRYEPGAFGLQQAEKRGGSWPKDYIWMPKFFVDSDSRSNYVLCILFFPPHILDRFYWHNKWMPSKTDPVNPRWAP